MDTRAAAVEERSVGSGRLGGWPVAAVAGLFCALPGLLARGADAGVAGLTWAALISLPVGCWAGGAPRRGGAALCGALVGISVLVWACAVARAGALATAWSAAGLAGLALIGFGVGRGSGGRAPGVAVALAALVLALELAPRGFLLAERPPASAAPALGRLLFDAAPSTWLLEAAGHDWMRHPSNYDPAGTDWFSGARAPYRAGLAGGSLLVLGCVTAAAGCALHRRSTPGDGRHVPTTT